MGLRQFLYVAQLVHDTERLIRFNDKLHIVIAIMSGYHQFAISAWERIRGESKESARQYKDKAAFITALEIGPPSP